MLYVLQEKSFFKIKKKTIETSLASLEQIQIVIQNIMIINNYFQTMSYTNTPHYII